MFDFASACDSAAEVTKVVQCRLQHWLHTSNQTRCLEAACSDTDWIWLPPRTVKVYQVYLGAKRASLDFFGAHDFTVEDFAWCIFGYRWPGSTSIGRYVPEHHVLPANDSIAINKIDTRPDRKNAILMINLIQVCLKTPSLCFSCPQ